MAQAADPVVWTTPSRMLKTGTHDILTCIYDRDVYSVRWKKKTPTTEEENLVILDDRYDVGERTWTSDYNKQNFNITDDFTLIIYDVKTEHEGTYTCEVSDLIKGQIFRNTTEVSIIGKYQMLLHL